MEKKKGNVWLVVGILAITVLLGIVCFRLDTDIMWHLKTGKYIVTHGGIPKGDVFSWHDNLSWMCHEWLYDILLFLFYNRFGAAAARFLLMVVFFIPMYMAYRYNRDQKDGIRYPFLFIIFFLAVMRLGFVVDGSDCARPSEFSILIFMYATILLIRKGISESYDKVTYIKLGLCSILYVNIHGGSIMQLILIPVLFLIADVLSGMLNGKIEWKRIKENLIVLLILFGCSLINPYGLSIYKYTTDNFLSAKFINSHIREWSFPVLNIPKAILFVGTMLCIGASKKFRSFDPEAFRKAILICAFLCQGLVIRRMLFPLDCLLLIFGYQFVEEYFTHIFEALARLLKCDLGHSKPFFKNVTQETRRIVSESLFVFSLILIFGTAGIYITQSDSGKSFLALVNEKNPNADEMIQYMKEHDIKGRIYTEYNDGGTLIINDIKTFVDPRCDPFMEAFSNVSIATDYFTARDVGETTCYEAFMKLHEKYNFEYAMIQKDGIGRNVIEMMKEKNETILLENDGYTLFKF